MKLIVMIALAIGSMSRCGAQFYPYNGPEPIAVLIQTTPWAAVIGAESPRIAVYEDGTVIFLKRSKEGASYQFRKLAEAELTDFKKHLEPVIALKTWKGFYNLRPNITDQPSAKFYVRDGGRELVTRVYGLREPGAAPLGGLGMSRRKPDTVPDALLELDKYLCALDFPDIKAWTPDFVEVMIWPYEYAPDASIIWPKDWPSLDSGRCWKTGSEMYSIFLDASTLPDLRNFLQTRKERGAVEMGGKKWAVSHRLVFPNEPAWESAFEAAIKK